MATSTTTTTTVPATSTTTTPVPVTTTTTTSAPLPSRYWIATLTGVKSEFGSGIALDAIGNTYIVGYTNSEGGGGYDVIIAKYLPNGMLDWQRTIGGALSERGYAITVDRVNNFLYVTGYSLSQGAGLQDLILAKYTTAGVILWQKALGGLGGDYGYGITMSGSDVCIVGTINSRGAGGNDVVIAKYRADGTNLWRYTLGDTGENYGYAVAVDSSNNSYIVGTIYGASSTNSLIVAKYDSSGTLGWQKSLAINASGISTTLDQTNGFLYVCGYTPSSVVGENASLIAKFDIATGNGVWQRILSNSLSNGITVNAAGEIYVTGVTNNGANFGGNDLLIVKCDSSGATLWQRSLGGTGSEFSGGIVTESNGSIYVSGATNQSSINADLLTLKLPGDGQPIGKLGKFTYSQTALTNTSLTVSTTTLSLTSINATQSNFTDRLITLTDRQSYLISDTVEFTTTPAPTTTTTTSTTTTTTTAAPTTTTAGPTTTTAPPVSPAPGPTTTTTGAPTTTTTAVPTTTTTPSPSGAIVSVGVVGALNEGGSNYWTVQTNGVANGIVLNWVINHISTNVADFTADYGTVTINNDSGSFLISPVADFSVNEGSETFSITISGPGIVPYTTSFKTLNDTSVSLTINSTTTTTAAPGGPTVTTLSPPRLFTITNIGTRPLIVRAVIFDNPAGIGHTADFSSLGGSSTERGDAVLSHTIVARGVRNFTVAYNDAGAGIGTYSGTIVVIAENNVRQKIDSTIIIV